MKRFLFFLIGALWALTPMSSLQAQTSLVCNGHVNVSVGATCDHTATAGFLPVGVTAVRYRPFEGSLYLQSGTSLTSAGNLILGTTPTNITTIAPAVMKLLLNKKHIYEMVGGGNTCWGTIVFEDKLPPVLTPPANDEIFCWTVDAFLAQRGLYSAEAKTLSLTGNTTLGVNVPTVSDNCGIEAVTVTDILVTPSECAPVYRRTWKVTDCGGNTATTSYTVTVRQPNYGPLGSDIIARIILPVNDTLECKSSTIPVCPTLDVFGNPVMTGGTYNSAAPGPHLPALRVDNVMTDAPLDSLDVCLGIGNKLCSYFVSYVDQTVDACALNCHGNSKIFRTWTIVDWCNGNITPHVQVIKVIDTEAPTAIAKDSTVTTRPWDCTADAFIPDLWELHDNCDLTPGVTLKAQDPWIIVYKVGSRWRASGMKCGPNQLQWELNDCCGNKSIIPVNIMVVDETPPVPVAKQDIVITVTPQDRNGVYDAQAKLFVASVDNGSHDNCSEILREIRRPAGPDCSNLGFRGHNNNRTFRSNPGTNYSPRTSSFTSPFANGTTVPNFGQNTTWTWFANDGCCGDRTLDAGKSPVDNDPYSVFSINVNEGTWIWRDRSTPANYRTELIGRYPNNTNWRVRTWGENGTSMYNFLDDDGGQYVKFCCEDITSAGTDWNGDGRLDTGYHQVIMRVWDDGNKDGCVGCWVLPTPGDLNPRQDNYNDTWANVKVENKVPPVLQCPPAVTVSCEAPITTNGTTTWLPATPSAFTFTGYPTAWAACGTPALEYRDVVSLNQCRSGSITRTFRVAGSNPLVSCTQIITVSSTFNSTNVWTFPGSWLGSPTSTSSSSRRFDPVSSGNMQVCSYPGNTPTVVQTDANVQTRYSKTVIETTNCDGPSETDIRNAQPFYTQGACDVIGVNIKKDQYNFEDGVCRKWVVNYHFMNWCDNKCVRFTAVSGYSEM
jgi:hypothetical protein